MYILPFKLCVLDNVYIQQMLAAPLACLAYGSVIIVTFVCC